MLPSAHLDTFARDHLPPPEQWPEILLDRPELQFPDRLNCVAAYSRSLSSSPRVRPAFSASDGA